MNTSTYIIKSNGKRRTEHYDKSKLFKSVTAACLSTRDPQGQAETTASQVCLKVEKWLASHPEVTSNDIRRITALHLKKYQPEAAYLYEQQHITI